MGAQLYVSAVESADQSHHAYLEATYQEQLTCWAAAQRIRANLLLHHIGFLADDD